MPHKRSPDKLLQKRERFERQTADTQAAWKRASADLKKIEKDAKRNKHVELLQQRVTAQQKQTEQRQKAEESRLQRWGARVRGRQCAEVWRRECCSWL